MDFYYKAIFASKGFSCFYLGYCRFQVVEIVCSQKHFNLFKYMITIPVCIPFEIYSLKGAFIWNTGGLDCSDRSHFSTWHHKWGWQIIQLSLHCFRLFSLANQWQVKCLLTRTNGGDLPTDEMQFFRRNAKGGLAWVRVHTSIRSERAAAGWLQQCGSDFELCSNILIMKLAYYEGLTPVDNHCAGWKKRRRSAQ